MADSVATLDANAKATALAYFGALFETTEWSPAEELNHELIDLLLGVIRNKERPVKQRTDSANELLCLLRKGDTRGVAERGALTLFAIEGVVDGFAKGATKPSDNNNKHGTLRTPALVAAMRRYPDDNYVLQNALFCLSTWDAESEPGLLELILGLLDTNDSSVVRTYAMRIMHGFNYSRNNHQPAEQARWERVIALPGYVSIMVRRLSSPSEAQKVRDDALGILHVMARGADAHIDLLLTEWRAVPLMLRYVLDSKESYTGNRDRPSSLWHTLAHILESLLRSPRPALLTNLLGSGVLQYFLDFGKKNEEDDRVAAKLGAILPSLMLVHPEFSGQVEKAGLGHLIPSRGRKVGQADYVIVDEDTDI